jgi:glycosyltransferase involved in cell wall biosynthesis
MMEEKGVWVLLEACKILKAKAIKFRCNFVGDWFDITPEEFKTKLDEYDLHDNVKAHGKKYGVEKAGFFMAADVFVFPTFYKNECFPLVLLEAMDYSLPVVSTPEGGIADIVKDGDTGFLVMQKDAKVLADKLELLSLQPLLGDKMGKAAKLRFDQMFTLDKFEKNLHDILKEETNFL